MCYEIEHEERHDESRRSIIVIRGPQGSGKSTIARKLNHPVIIETDDFFTFGDKYIYDRDFGKECFQFFLARVRLTLLNNATDSVVITGVLSTEVPLKPLFEVLDEFLNDILVVRATGNFQNVHGVPDEIVNAAKKNFLPFKKFNELYRIG